MPSRFEIAVIGGGLIGSSAARHLAEAGHRVVVIAAPEPAEWETSTGPFSSHCDAGRITRVTASDPVWAELAHRSIGRYADIEARSGITFHQGRGLAWLDRSVADAVATSTDRGAGARQVTPEWLYATTGIRTPAGLEAAYEGAPAGLVNPRALAAAQLRLVTHAGGIVIAGAATSLDRVGARVAVRGAFDAVEADRVLVATGGFGQSLLEPFDMRLDVLRLLRTIVRCDLGPAPEMPSLIIGEVDHPAVNDLYWVPPVRFPDGRVLFKVGCEVLDAPQAESERDLVAWFNAGGDDAEAAALREVTRSLLPGAHIRSSDQRPCMITRTTSGYPHLGWIDEGVAVAIGGNGAAAKSCDEIGRLASTLFSPGGWDDQVLDAAVFEPRTF
ncbi:MAG: FAD-binding oxidoreductase [Actinomycetota bacterium]